MPRLDKTVLWPVEKRLFGFVWYDVVFDGQLLHDVGQPDEIINVHGPLPALLPTAIIISYAPEVVHDTNNSPLGIAAGRRE